MSRTNEPKPIAETAAMLALRFARIASRKWDGTHQEGEDRGYRIDAARLASDLHKLAPVCQTVAEYRCGIDHPHAAELCNGAGKAINPEEYGDNAKPEGAWEAAGHRKASRMIKALAAINERLAPLALRAHAHGDPRGHVLKLESTDSKRPAPRNGWDECWAVWN